MTTPTWKHWLKHHLCVCVNWDYLGWWEEWLSSSPPRLNSCKWDDEFVVMALSLVVESDQSIKDWNMYIPHTEYNDISHKKKCVIFSQISYEHIILQDKKKNEKHKWHFKRETRSIFLTLINDIHDAKSKIIFYRWGYTPKITKSDFIHEALYPKSAFIQGYMCWKMK